MKIFEDVWNFGSIPYVISSNGEVYGDENWARKKNFWRCLDLWIFLGLSFYGNIYFLLEINDFWLL